MRTVVDTNVVAYLLLGPQPFEEEAHQFWQTVDQPIAPTFWEAEFANVVWQAVRARFLGHADGLARLEAALRLGIHSIPIRTLWASALERSISSGVAVYDTLFIELADREDAPLATFDTKVLAAFPMIAKRPRDLLPKR